jgi:tetratricopeptide (TPR) repeat protein
MRKKHRNKKQGQTAGGGGHFTTPSEFYSSAPTEQPLSGDQRSFSKNRVQKTGRHKVQEGRRKETIDPREKMALLAILRSVIVIILLGIAFFLLHKGIKLYEENVRIERLAAAAPSEPVIRKVFHGEEFDVASQMFEGQFAERIGMWQDANRLVRSADGLLQRNNYDEAIARCLDALHLDPFHKGALERLGELYLSRTSYEEAVNVYIRLLSVDPGQADIQKDLIHALDAYGDSDGVMQMAKWYLEENTYDADVQRYFANALYALGSFEEAADAYERVARDLPHDSQVLEKLSTAYMKIGQYERALPVFERLRESNFREQRYYNLMAVCRAQLGQGSETVQVLARAAHLFGQQVVMGWMQDTQFDVVREDRDFQSFANRIGGEGFRLWLEKMAEAVEAAEQQKAVAPTLGQPNKGTVDPGILQPRK